MRVSRRVRLRGSGRAVGGGAHRRSRGAHLRHLVVFPVSVARRRRRGRGSGALLRGHLGHHRAGALYERDGLRAALRPPDGFAGGRDLRSVHGVREWGCYSRRERRAVDQLRGVDRRDVLGVAALDQTGAQLAASQGAGRDEGHGRVAAWRAELHGVPDHGVHVQDAGGGRALHGDARARGGRRQVRDGALGGDGELQQRERPRRLSRRVDAERSVGRGDGCAHGVQDGGRRGSHAVRRRAEQRSRFARSRGGERRERRVRQPLRRGAESNARRQPPPRRVGRLDAR
mmetsp:Transcript_1889/g.7862  ORF Transcript_1889/g.7862 Transcript_1889/m.7862 type:complete len:287 (-) Transcript_1889:179-1039(-)